MYRRSATISKAASSAGSVALTSRASKFSPEQEIWAQSVIHSRWSATPPFGRAPGKPSGKGSPPASRTGSRCSDAAGDRTPTRGRLLGAVKLLHEKLAHPAAVGVAAGRLHHLADEETNDFFVPAADPLGFVRVARYDLVHHPGELVAAHRSQTLALHDDRRGLAGFKDGAKYILRGGAGDGAVLNQPDQLGHRFRGYPGLGNARPRLVQACPELAGDPISGLFGVGSFASGDLLVEVGEVGVRREDAGVVLGEPVLLDEAHPLLLGQLGDAALYLADPGVRELQGQKVGLGEVAVVVGVLLAPQLVDLVGLRVVVERRLCDASAALQDLALALQFSHEAALDEAKGVHVLELGLGAEGAVGVADAHVGVNAQLALLHVGLGDAYGPEDGTKLGRRRSRGLRGGDVGLSDDLYERGAAPVEVHERADRAVHPARLSHVHVLGGILFEVEARDADPDRAFGGPALEVGVGADRLVVLGDLVTFWQVGVEVVLAREDGVGHDLAVQGKPRHDPEV